MSPITEQIIKNLRFDFAHICEFVFFNALLANFLPASSGLKRWPRMRYCYEVLIDLIACFSLNLRTRLPSLDAEFIGFRRLTRHAYRNWRQDRMDREACRRMEEAGLSVSESGRIRIKVIRRNEEA